LSADRYMAPEICKHALRPIQNFNKTYTEQADVYSFGVIMWELINNQDAWADLTPLGIQGNVSDHKRRNAILVAVTEGQQPHPPPDAQGTDLQRIVEWCLSPVPEMRPTFAWLAVR
jgi:serine/threonine protein kinase